MKLTILVSMLACALALHSPLIVNSHSSLRGEVSVDPLPLTSYFNNLLSLLQPTIAQALASNLPSSYGNCNADNAPKPCICSNGCEDLYYTHKKWEYEAYARWVSGLNTLNLTSMAFVSEGNSKIGVSVSGEFASLPASIYIGECFTFDLCSVLWDNTHGCCGNNLHFTIELSFDCNATNPDAYLSDIAIQEISTDNIELTESIGSIKFNVENLTGAVKGAIQSILHSAITQAPFIPWPPQKGAQKYDVLGLLNFFAKSTTQGAPITCN